MADTEYSMALREIEEAASQHRALFEYSDGMGIAYPEAMSLTADRIELAYRSWQEAKVRR